LKLADLWDRPNTNALNYPVSGIGDVVIPVLFGASLVAEGIGLFRNPKPATCRPVRIFRSGKSAFPVYSVFVGQFDIAFAELRDRTVQSGW